MKEINIPLLQINKVKYAGLIKLQENSSTVKKPVIKPDVSNRVRELINKCNSIIETEGIETENFKSSILTLNMFLNRKSYVQELTKYDNYEEVRNYVKNIVLSLSLNVNETKNAD